MAGMNITENDPIDIYWKDPTEKFIQIRDDESFTSALNVGGHLIQFTNFFMQFVMVSDTLTMERELFGNY